MQGMQDTPIFGHKYVMNDEEWDTFCTGMNKLGKIAKEEYGISLTFHHHMGTVVQNPDEVERMMENTDPEYVSLLFDTGHFTYCGADPLEMVKKYVSRIKHVHLKDIRPEVVEKVKNEALFIPIMTKISMPFNLEEQQIENKKMGGKLCIQS